MKKFGLFFIVTLLVVGLIQPQNLVYGAPATNENGGNTNTKPAKPAPNPAPNPKPAPKPNNPNTKQQNNKKDNNKNNKSYNQKSKSGSYGNSNGYRDGYVGNRYGSTSTVTKKKKNKNKGKLSIIFTSDIHSHLTSDHGKGGLAKIKTKIDEIKEEYPDSFLLDGGDFSMGTPFQTIFMREAAELRMLGYLDYDVTTLGNHEFDYRAKGLADMFKTAEKSKKVTRVTEIEYDKNTGMKTKKTIENQYMPDVVSANIDWNATLKDKKLSKDARRLKKAMASYGVQDYTVVEKGDARVAVFGLMGEEAIEDAPLSGLKWQNYMERAKKIVEEIKRNGEADYIVCLSHSGYYRDKGNDSEDIKLAKAVPDIDVIISGHSHETLDKPITVGKTQVVACGAYAKYLGHLVLNINKKGLSADSYKLHAMDKDVKEDSGTNAKLSTFKSLINEEYFSKFGYSTDQRLAESDFDFEKMDSFAKNHSDSNLGNIISDSYIYAVKKFEGSKYEPITCSVVPGGVVRGTFEKGKITVGDAFNVSSLGIGPDGVPGYPVVSVYLTGKEIKNLIEVDASISPRMPSAIIHMSGINYKTNNHRLILNRATDIKRVKADGSYENLSNNKLYRVVGGLYSCQMLGLVTEQSKGLLSITPKDKKGKEIKNFDKHIVKSGGKELKEWYALAKYIDSFKGGKVPSKYEKADARKTADNSYAPWSIVRQPNNYGVMILAILLIPVVIIVGLIIFFRRRKHQRRGFASSMFGPKRKNKRVFLRKKNMGLKKKNRRF